MGASVAGHSTGRPVFLPAPLDQWFRKTVNRVRRALERTEKAPVSECG